MWQHGPLKLPERRAHFLPCYRCSRSLLFSISQCRLVKQSTVTRKSYLNLLLGQEMASYLGNLVNRKTRIESNFVPQQMPVLIARLELLDGHRITLEYSSGTVMLLCKSRYEFATDPSWRHQVSIALLYIVRSGRISRKCTLLILSRVALECLFYI